MKRTKYPKENIKDKNWQQMKPYFEELAAEDVSSVTFLVKWLEKKDSLFAQLSEEMAWRYINMTRYSNNDEYQKKFNWFVEEIIPHTKEWDNRFNEKILASPAIAQIDKPEYQLLFDRIKKEKNLFRKENIERMSKETTTAMEFGSISGSMTIEEDGAELTMQQAATLLKSPNREKRERVFKKMWQRREQDQEALDDLMNRLIALRHQIAQEAGFENYRDYRFQELYRVDYGVAECFQFHDAIEKQIMPLVDKIHQRRKKQMKLEKLKPWDLSVDVQGKKPPQLFKDAKELTQKSIHILKKLDPFFGECLSTMEQKGFLDLESRKNKAPGGYNYPLAESNIPFIFMNASGRTDDISTMLHESGHAIHSFLTKDLPLVDFKRTPSEVAELASMSMELFSMHYWDVFFEENATTEHIKAMREQLENVLLILPWVATVDAFQHWLYENPHHSNEERQQKWQEIYFRFLSKEIDYDDVPSALSLRWQAQMHIFEVPFYYIEYAIAQLGALANWIQFRKNKEEALTKYKKALSLGYTRSIPKVYEASGIRFDFSANYVGKLAKEVFAYFEELEKK